jgi:hypothetical protein
MAGTCPVFFSREGPIKAAGLGAGRGDREAGGGRPSTCCFPKEGVVVFLLETKMEWR